MSWWPQEELTTRQAVAVIAQGAADVVVAHDAPTEVDVPGLPPRSTWPEQEMARADRHRDLVQTVVDHVRPQQYWHGHFHSNYDTWVHRGDTATYYRGLNCDGAWVMANVDLVDLQDGLPKLSF